MKLTWTKINKPSFFVDVVTSTGKTIRVWISTDYSDPTNRKSVYYRVWFENVRLAGDTFITLPEAKEYAEEVIAKLSGEVKE